MHPGFLLTRPCHINNSARRNETLSSAGPIRISQAGSREPVQAASLITGRQSVFPRRSLPVPPPLGGTNRRLDAASAPMDSFGVVGLFGETGPFAVPGNSVQLTAEARSRPDPRCHRREEANLRPLAPRLNYITC